MTHNHSESRTKIIFCNGSIRTHECTITHISGATVLLCSERYFSSIEGALRIQTFDL